MKEWRLILKNTLLAWVKLWISLVGLLMETFGIMEVHNSINYMTKVESFLDILIQNEYILQLKTAVDLVEPLLTIRFLFSPALLNTT